MNNGALYEAFDDKNVQQIVSFCGNGRLTNESECAYEFKTYLETLNEKKLFEHANYCLENAFDKSGCVLQDVVNEMGRRIGYSVENGLYTGKKNDIGFDGIWKNGNEWIVVEVKTTDAYRINLDTVMGYAKKLEDTTDEITFMSALIVGGRQDTGDLEAQIRGSKHAWSVRLISVDALSKLMFLNAELDDEEFGYKVNKILKPFEYTRVDEIVDLIFETQKETEKTITGDDFGGDKESAAYEFTPKNELNSKRSSIVSAFYNSKNMSFEKKSQVNFASEDGGVGICCAVSKKYERKYQPYWYALHPKWIEFLEEFNEAYFVLGCMDRNEAFCIPLSVVKENLDFLNQTDKGDKFYWHITLKEDDDKIYWNLPKSNKNISLKEFAIILNN